MKIVGEKLENWALAENSADEKDLFGRSAFNRYYYSAFLLTRKMLGEFKSQWMKEKHANIPNLLRTTVTNEVKKALKAAEKDNILQRGEASRILQAQKSSANRLANLLEDAYKIRIIADYEPEIAIRQNKKIITLDRYKLTSAKSWPDQAGALCGAIRKAWKESGLVD